MIGQGERPFAVGILLQWFWSSVTLTGNETKSSVLGRRSRFWSSVALTGHEAEYKQSNMALKGDMDT